MTSVNLLLDYLDVSVELDVSGIISTQPADISIEHDAVAEIDVDTNVIRGLFQFGFDGFDDTDTKNPTRFYVVNQNIPDLLNVGSDSYMTENAIGVSDIIGNNYTTTYQSIKYDFIRYLAYKLFNTHFAVDLFINGELL